MQIPFDMIVIAMVALIFLLTMRVFYGAAVGWQS